mmetsp:Transcript_24679/g.53238  ORF Transcript_24679/g.53238 Transcript_24679/m.53238 type:complete len:955 (-) Transcript_24679:48-2912(-)
MMKIISLLSILTVIQLQHSSLIHGSDATIDASGETTIAEEETTPTPCQPKKLLNGKLSSCDTFQIATLNASPRRCIHIEAPPPPSDDDNNILVCANYPNWFDGTNGCNAYRRKGGWCAEYGSINYPIAQHTANQACCACGGGTRDKPRLQAGEYVKLTGYGPYDECESLKIVKLGTKPQFHYLLEVMKPCGPNKAVRDARGAVIVEQTFQPGMQVTVASDDPSVIAKHNRVELKKCRRGKQEQEFIVNPIGVEGGSDIVVIQHKLTGVELSSALGAKSPFFNITQVFEDGLFEGSGDFHFLKVVTNTNQGRINADGTPYGPTHSYLASGYFGQKEYSMVKTFSLLSSSGFEQQEFSMWRFQPIVENESDDGSAAVDEHAQWLIRMTQLIGIDYLVQLPPWHLLDVERDATKSDVKSRFRVLSRSFHPDKQVHQSENKKMFEKIFVLLQNAYQGLKSADEKEKEKFRVQAESGSQLFAHSQYVVELLPFHWSKLDNTTEEESSNSRYILNVASHLNSTLLDTTSAEEESEPSVQLWVIFVYSARCGMSRTVVGKIDLAARHLDQHENIKVGAYGCGLYKEHPLKENDPTGVKSDPICAQFERRETPNVHLIVETIPGRKRDENGELVEVHPDMEIVKENAQFKYFYAAVPSGNTTQFYPHNFINFATAGKRVWQNNHLVHRMKRKDFLDPRFIGNVSIVAYLDGTGNGETDTEVVDAIANSLPGFSRRFLNDDLYVGIAHCGFGDDEFIDQNDVKSQKYVDCSKLDVSWLPDIKVYGVDDTKGVSLLRGQFSDMRDVQIALESMGNTLRMMLGGTDNDNEDEFEEIEDNDDAEESGGGCDNKQPPPPPPDYEDLDEIEGRMEDTPLLEMQTEEEEEASETNPVLETESKPVLEQSTDKAPKKPKLASGSDMPQLAGGRENMVRDGISGFHKRETKRLGGGQILGGGGGGSAGFIA